MKTIVKFYDENGNSNGSHAILTNGLINNAIRLAHAWVSMGAEYSAKVYRLSSLNSQQVVITTICEKAMNQQGYNLYPNETLETIAGIRA